jgi:hypothetical protein
VGLDDILTVLFTFLYDALISLLLRLRATTANLLSRFPKNWGFGLIVRAEVSQM